MVVFGKTIYGRWFASYSIWVGREPSSCPYRTAGLMFTYKHTWQKGWVNRALRSFSKTGFWDMSEAVWPGADQSVTKITASFQTSFFFLKHFQLASSLLLQLRAQQGSAGRLSCWAAPQTWGLDQPSGSLCGWTRHPRRGTTLPLVQS